MFADRKWLWIGLAVLAFAVVALIVGGILIAQLGKPGETTTAASDNFEVAELVYVNGSVSHREVTDFSTFVKNADKPVFVDFWATWCAPCRAAAPFVESLAKEYAGKAYILKVDIDQARELANQYGIQSIPTFIVLKQGVVKDSTSGYAESIEADLRQMLENQIG